MQTRLERSTTNRVIGGVCGGIAEYLQVDPTLVRVFFVIATIMTAGIGILGYIALILLMPLPGQPQPFVQGASASAQSGEPSTEQTTVVTPAAPRDPDAEERRRSAFGYFLVALGVVFLLSNLGAFRIVRWEFVWPLVFIAAGALLLAQRVRR